MSRGKRKQESVREENFLIECLIRRQGGTKVTFGKRREVVYHFSPNDGMHHVCPVRDPDHRRTLLAIEGYKVYDPDGEPLPDVILGGKYTGYTREKILETLKRRTRDDVPVDAPMSELSRLLNLTDTVYER